MLSEYQEYQAVIRQSIAFVERIRIKGICSLVTWLRDYNRLVSGAISLRFESGGGSSEELRERVFFTVSLCDDSYSRPEQVTSVERLEGITLLRTRPIRPCLPSS